MVKKKASTPASAIRVANSPFSRSVSSSPFGSSAGLFSSISPLSFAQPPPDYSTISEPSVVVSFKSLLKQSEVTKRKAVDDILALAEEHLKAEKPLDDGVVQAWLQLYPRLSVDISSPVRKAAHAVMGTIAKSEGKRIVRQLGSVAGAWLAGLYDQDKGVAKTALESVKSAFGEDKVDKFWQIYQEKILDYCRTVIFHETVHTLSDDRHVSPDDSASKYSRVISTAIPAVSHLLYKLDKEAVDRHIVSYQEMFSSKQLWEFGSDSDPYIRRSIYQLAQVAIEKRIDLFQENMPLITTHALWKALQISQGVAVLPFLQFLQALLLSCPEAWTTTKTGKKSATPISIFATFCGNGPQAAPADDYWGYVDCYINLFRTMEPNQLPTDLKTAQKLIDAVKAGTTRKFGNKVVNASSAAWDAFFNIVYSELSILSETDAEQIVKSYLLPTFLDWVFDDAAAQNKLSWDDIAIRRPALIKAIMRGKRVGELAFNPIWRAMEIRIEKLLLEGEKDADKKKAWISRWARLTENLVNKVPEMATARRLIEDTLLTLYVVCLRNIGAAKTGSDTAGVTLLNELLSFKQSTIWQKKDIEQETNNFFVAKLPSLLPGDHTTELLSAVIGLGARTNQGTTFHTSWKLSLETLLGLPDKDKLNSSILFLFRKPFEGESLPFPDPLRDYLETKLKEAIKNPEAANWEILQSVILSHGRFATEGFAGQLLSAFIQSLSSEQLAPFIITVIENIAREDADYLKSYVSRNQSSASELLTRLLSLSHELDEKISRSASFITSVLEKSTTETSTAAGEEKDVSMIENMISAIKKAVHDGDKDWLTVESLFERANTLLSRQSEEQREATVNKFLFTKSEWETALGPFWTKKPSPSLAISSPLAGATFIVTVQEVMADPTPASYDEDGLSGALRMAHFTQMLLEQNKIRPSTDSAYYLSLTLSLIKDNLDIAGANDIFSDYSADTTAHSAQLTYKMEDMLSSVANGDTKLIEMLTEAADGPGAFNYYNARALAGFLARSLEKGGLSVELVKEMQEKIQLGQEGSFLSIALLTSLLPKIDKEQVSAWRDRAIRDVTSFNFAKSGSPYRKGISKLVYLNALLPGPEDDGQEKLTISLNALRFLVGHILEWNLSTWIEEVLLTEDDSCLAAETAKTLTLILPFVKETRGPHWSDVADFLESFPKTCDQKITMEQVPALYWILKLLGAYRKLAVEGHGDVAEEWDETEKKITKELLHVLEISKAKSIDDLPRDTTNRLLARELSKINIREIVAPEQLYELVSVQSEPIQDVAFQILHRYVPSIQEDLSIELALTASQEEPLKIEFEPALIDLLKDVPLDSHWENVSVEKGQYLSLKTYLLSWLLIFDHFENSTILLKGKYIDLLKDLEVAEKLWAFTFDILGFTIGKPLDASKYPITTYDSTNEPDALLDICQLTVHLYYLSLQYSRVLLNNYLNTIKNRQTTLSVESFTSKYISPILISTALSEVKEWRLTSTSTPQTAQNVQGEEIEGGQLTVKISLSAAEVLASYTIDTQTLEVSITLSPTYPLSPPNVAGIKRVGMSEKQYLSIIRATKSTIALHGGTLVDGLSLFEKNLNAHFSGVGECTICYSILSLQDGSLPGKKCGVCKNGFHAGCLFKWFKSTNQSSCPLCRTSWQF